MIKLFKVPSTGDEKRDFYARCIAFIIVAIGFIMSVRNLLTGLSDISNATSVETVVESVMDAEPKEREGE